MQSLYETTVVLDRESTVPAPEPVASSSGARYLALAIVVTIISLLHCNVLSLACSIPGIIYASKVTQSIETRLQCTLQHVYTNILLFSYRLEAQPVKATKEEPT